MTTLIISIDSALTLFMQDAYQINYDYLVPLTKLPHLLNSMTSQDLFNSH